MKKYKNISRKSGITHFEIGIDYIEVKFKEKTAIYIYSNNITGKKHIEKMKALATAGQGLCTYIAKNPSVKNNYRKR